MNVKWKPWVAVGAAVILLASVAVVSRALSPKPIASPEAQPPLVTIVTPTNGAVPLSLHLTGMISARNDVAVGPEGEGGRIAEVLVDVGQHVQRGQVLARIDAVVAEAQVAAAEATLEEARSSSAVAQAEYARAEGARDSFSVEERERRRTTAANARSKVDLAAAQLKQARTRWQRTNIVAPVAGIVLQRDAERGQMAMPGASVLFRLAQGAELEMRAQVAEQDMPRLQVGQVARVFVTGVAGAYDDKVWQLGAVIDQQTRQGTVRIALAGGDANLRPGAFARAELAVAAAQGAVVPQTAVLADAAGSYVMVLDRELRARRRDVIAVSPHPDGVLISSGLAGGERVVATAGAFLHAGEQVRVAAGSPAAVASATP